MPNAAGVKVRNLLEKVMPQVLEQKIVYHERNDAYKRPSTHHQLWLEWRWSNALSLFDNESMKDFPYLNNEERRENDPKGALER